MLKNTWVENQPFTKNVQKLTLLNLLFPQTGGSFVMYLYNKDTQKMTIQNKLLKKWESELRGYGLLDCAIEMGVNYRTLYRVFKTGKCTVKVFDKINTFILAKRESIKIKSELITEA